MSGTRLPLHQRSAVDAYFDQLRDAVERHAYERNFATEGALITACAAIRGEQWACDALDNDPAWKLGREALGA